MDRSRSYAVKVPKDHPVVTSFLVCLVASAILNRTLAKKAERRNPPTGRFVTIDGVRLHYVERGTGRPLVLLHGNGSMIFRTSNSSGLIDLAAMKYRVIAFDRPGFGHSDRPRRTVWTPEAQAALLNAALTKMGVSQPPVFGHSWGNVGCSSPCAELSTKCPSIDSRLRLLLSDRSSGCVGAIAASAAIRR